MKDLNCNWYSLSKLPSDSYHIGPQIKQMEFLCILIGTVRIDISITRFYFLKYNRCPKYGQLDNN